jgi:hypothetical protein
MGEGCEPSRRIGGLEWVRKTRKLDCNLYGVNGFEKLVTAIGIGVRGGNGQGVSSSSTLCSDTPKKVWSLTHVKSIDDTEGRFFPFTIQSTLTAMVNKCGNVGPFVRGIGSRGSAVEPIMTPRNRQSLDDSGGCWTWSVPATPPQHLYLHCLSRFPH